ncbi:MAG: uroporphyrinogen decarboxylase family protein [Oscillospiraceae bacterium]|nr:uroporphyrinogen decarboxylase family protein [Oscillospiraceae bacterium]
MANELLIKAATYQYPEQIPVSFGFLPAVFIKYGDEIKKILSKYEDLLGNWWQNYDPYANLSESYRKGGYTDIWDCVWSNEVDGMAAIVTGHPVKTREDVHTMKVPEGDHWLPHGFMYLILLDLRGFEEAMVDFFEEPPELQMLIDKVLNYNLKQTKYMLENNKEKMVYFGDDLGMQKGLAIGAEKWRKYMKPCFSAIYKLCKDDGRLVYMHTDGDIHEIMPDLQECGVDIINPQIRANGLDNLEKICKGKIPINLDLDRQLFPFGTPSDMRKHVEECVKRLYLPEGGLGLNIEIGPDDPLENIEALCDAVGEIRFYKG